MGMAIVQFVWVMIRKKKACIHKGGSWYNMCQVLMT